MQVKPRIRRPKQRLWTVKEFYRMAERGILHPAERLELMEGVIYEMMSINPPHAGTVDHNRDVLARAFGPGFYVRVQQPIHLGPRSEPIPDLAVVTGTPRDYIQQHPTMASLLMEVSDTTLGYDRRRKGSLFARAGIADYWIVNLKKRHLEVYRDPIPDSTHYHGHRYSSLTILTDKDAVSPLACPTSRILVADLLP